PGIRTSRKPGGAGREGVGFGGWLIEGVLRAIRFCPQVPGFIFVYSNAAEPPPSRFHLPSGTGGDRSRPARGTYHLARGAQKKPALRNPKDRLPLRHGGGGCGGQG